MKEGMSRRKLILGGVAAAAAAAGGSMLLRSGDKGIEKPEEERPRSQEIAAEIDVPQSLRGRNFNDLFTHYTGVSGRVPDRIPGNFPTQQLPRLWDVKKQRHGETPAVAAARAELVGSYDQGAAEKIGWQEFRSRGEASIHSLRRGLDWNAVGRHFHLNDIDLRLLREFESQVDGTSLTSYALTELMPGVDGVLNREVFDFILRVGGREYVERIPAVNDAKTSVGAYQFTEYALFDVGREKRGASRVNQYLPPNLRIPGSVVKMRGDDHHKAAYLFAICNLALLMRGINEADKKQLFGKASQIRPSITEFIATAHNLPAVAIRNFRSYLIAFLGRDPRIQTNSGAKKKKAPGKVKKKSLPVIGLGPSADYLQHTRRGGLVWNYARKTRANYRTVSSS